MKLMILFAGLFIGLASACSQGSGASTEIREESSVVGDSPSAVSIASFETCTGLLDLEDVQKAAGRSDIEIGDPNVNSGVAESNGAGIRTMCIYEYITPEILIDAPSQLRGPGPSMLLTAITFDSDENAAAHYRLVLEAFRSTMDSANPGSVITEGVLGDESYLFTAEAEGFGSAIGFLVGPYLAQLVTTFPEGQTSLVAPQELKAIAGTILEQLATPQ